jgi:hypothetical protein
MADCTPLGLVECPPVTTRLETLISAEFNSTHVRACLKHFAEQLEEFQKGDWEKSIGKGGKFVEAALKALFVRTGGTLPPARQFKVASVLNALKQLTVGSYNDTIRITIPRACEYAYDIASNRGARHDPGEVDPNEQDAHAVLGTVSWILAELLRYSQKGKVTQQETKELIAGLVQRRYPAIEDIDGRIYFHLPNLSARDVALLALWQQHPSRLSREELLEAVRRNGHSQAAALSGVARIGRVVDVDAQGKLRLLMPGIVEAESLMETGRGI